MAGVRGGVGVNIILQNETIGQVSAEADENFLFQCFVDHSALAEIKDRTSPKMVLLGSTGSGKTALLMMLQKNSETCRSIELDEVSLNYISNSDVVNYLIDLGVPLDHFFQAMWKHVIVSEYIKIKYQVDNEAKSSSFLRRIADSLGLSAKRKKALAYLEKWRHKFWVEFDENVREITQKLEAEVNASLGAEVHKYKMDAGYMSKLSQEKRANYQRRVRQFVEADLLSELGNVVQLLADQDMDGQRQFYLVFDRLDDHWVDNNVKYHLIRALIESLKGLRRLTDLKVAVALRSDIMEKVIFDTRLLGFQSEKYSDYMVKLYWTNDQLKQLVDKRIGFQFRRKYTKENVHFDDIFVDRVDKEKTFQYMLDRTLLRPRDIISFVNFALEQGNGKATVRRDDVRAAERLYSESRRQALIDEWKATFSGIEPTLSLLKGRRATFPLYELNTTDFSNAVIALFFDRDKYNNDPIVAEVENLTMLGSSGDPSTLIASVFERLYLVGAVGVKTAATLPVQWFHKTQTRLDRHSFGLDAKVSVHPMLHVSLQIRP